MTQQVFVPGQRWISNTEADLGLGIVVESMNRRVELSFPAAAEVRTYATDNAPLSRVCYEADEEIFNDEGDRLRVRERIEHKGCYLYLCSNDQGEEVILPELHLDSAVHFSKPQERLFAGQIDRHSLFKLRVETLEHRHQLMSSPAWGLIGPRVQLLPHQLYIASELASRPAPRALLADEVGLGKTIEAGLILHQRLLSGRAQRVLVLLPDSLLHQWLVEMLRRFNLSFTLLDAERCEGLEESGQTNPFETAQLILCPLSLLCRDEQRLAQAQAVEWDLLIVDEAHHLGWSREVVSHAYQSVERLTQIAKGVLLLTATPEQLGPEGHFARLRLLDPERYPDLDQFLAESRQYHHLNHLISCLLEGGAAFLRQDASMQRELSDRLGAEVIEHWLSLKALEQDAGLKQLMRQLVDQQGTGRVLFRNTRLTVSGFPKRQLHTYALTAPALFMPLEQEHSLEPALHPEHRLGQDWVQQDPRVGWLQEWLAQNKKDKVLVICAHAETAIALEGFLAVRSGVRTTLFHEGMSLIQRDRSAAYFAEEELGARVLISSEIGSEGRNFQFCHHLVLFDLPLSPDLLEQRIGRLDRIGQHRDVNIHLPYYRQSATEVLMRWYDEGLDAFERVCAVGDALYQEFAQPLRDAMRHPGESHALEQLLNKTRQTRLELEQTLAEGRDRLLEMSSFNQEKADQVLESVQQLENSQRLQEYAEKLFDRYGIAIQPHGARGLVLHPGEHLLCQLTELPEEGMTLTFSRREALAREDIEFMSWEHPLLSELMELLSQHETGNNSVCVLKLPALPAGTLLLESIFVPVLAAPKSLQLSRYQDTGYLRFLTTPDGRDLAAALAHQPLNQLMDTVPLATAQSMVRMAREAISDQLKTARRLADQQLPGLIEQAQKRLDAERSAQWQRLQALARVNPALGPADLQWHEEETQSMRNALHSASLRLDALRVILVSE
ncbi:RNA polymerase-associated protein RapA [Nitrincola tapanii]|uniref:RNA polymerase-associated protein RapA n=1 Tax=Nitrincola tapanii TaxID=1708751 RepID=A0A5A9W316_9GAMM|nr:RNA polymerase-associated protein RapA [Nitrincola tapanii]